MKTAIIYASHHHGNTKKLIDAIKEKFDVLVVNSENEQIPDLSDYDCIGLASGIEFGKFYKSVYIAANGVIQQGKDIFIIYTCGQDNGKQGREIKAIAQERGCKILGSFGCKGYDTFGPFKLVGGINKKHPNDGDIKAALMFCQKIFNAAQR
ncbi:MAG: flavodoxin domain-containing protein [Firmicutes bacterium]|nr:flavodoxin domain-containing protein [Bacillota bacterium]